MAYILKHIAIRIWATILLGGLASLWVLPAFQSYTGFEWAILPVSIILLLVFMGVGWAFNRLGENLVGRLIREATAWERDSMHPEAEKAFRKAVTVFDSFLISPLMKRRKSAHLTARLARFYIARADKDYASEDFVLTYLNTHPEDEEVAEYWLQQVTSQVEPKKEHHELASRIGNIQPRNKNIQYLLTQLYLSEERTDFSALQTYRRVLNRDPKTAKKVVGKLAAIFMGEGRADDLALKIYIQAYQLNYDRPKLLRGIAACVHWIQETERTQKLFQAAKKLLTGVDEEHLKALRAGFNPPVLPPIKQKQSLIMIKRLGITLSVTISLMGNALLNFIRSTINVIIAQLGDLIHFIKSSRRSRVIIKWVTIVVLAVGVVILVINTFEHLIKKEKTSTKPAQTTAAGVVTDRFTIQIAAYLKPKHAERYVKHLKKQGLDAFWTEATGANRKWYQVRVSHFPDKASARIYGEYLKAQGVIDDFYVANYEFSQ